MQISAQRAPFPSPSVGQRKSDDTSASNAMVLDEVDFTKFQPGKTFTQNNAAILGAMATASYSDEPDQKAHYDHQPGVRSFQFLDSKNNSSLGIDHRDTGTQVSLVQVDGALLVAARGTTPPWSDSSGDDSEWKDFQQDLIAVPVDNYDHSAKVHFGFKDAADGIWDQLKPHLNTALATHKAIYLSGHSLGAAVALQLADRMVVEMQAPPKAVIRMGGPDIGWEDEKTHLDDVGLSQRTFNFINCTDPVPHLLPNGVAAGREIYLDRHGIADISGKSHKLDQALGEAEDIFHGHADPTHHHNPRLYDQHMEDPRNAATFKLVEINSQ